MKIKRIFNTMDCLEVMKLKEDNSIDLIITSPPYNLGNKKSGDIKVNSYKDNMSQEDYEAWQIEFLNECYRVLKPKGAIFYNHKNRYSKGEVITPWKWVLQSNLKVKQEIIWNRLTTADREASKFAPLDEKVFWLYKDKTFRLKRGAQNFTNIWDIKRPTKAQNMGHKATFPYELIYRIINSLDVDLSTIHLFDPFMGTGTTLQVGETLGCGILEGCELNKHWFDIALEKISTLYDFKEEIPKIKKPYKKVDKKK